MPEETKRVLEIVTIKGLILYEVLATTNRGFIDNSNSKNTAIVYAHKELAVAIDCTDT